MQKTYGAIQLIGWLFGIPIMIACLLSTVPALQSPSWPMVPGIVRTVAYGSSNRGGDRWEISVDYRVGDTAHACHRVAFSPSSVTRGQVDRHPMGSQAQVNYQPSNPTKCVLEPGFSLPLGFPWLGAIILLVAAKYSRARARIFSPLASSPVFPADKPASRKLFSKPPETAQLADVAALAAQGRTLEAMKLYRRTTGASLKEAKDYVDRLKDGPQ